MDLLILPNFLFLCFMTKSLCQDCRFFFDKYLVYLGVRKKFCGIKGIHEYFSF